MADAYNNLTDLLLLVLLQCINISVKLFCMELCFVADVYNIMTDYC